MRIEIADFDDVQTGFDPIPNGRFPFTISGCEKKKAIEGSGEYLSWELTCNDSDHQGRKLWNNTSLQPQALFALKGFLEAAGCDMESDGFNTEDAVGCKLDVQVGQKEYEGKITNECSAFFPSSD